MAISPARQITFDVLRRVAREDAYASDLLFGRLGRDTPQTDAALATELTLGVLRWQGLLDFLLGRHIHRPVESLDAEVLLALRLGLYQLRFLDRVPAHAAVCESVELVKRRGKSSAAGFVNAVLRRMTASARVAGEALERLLPENLPNSERVAILYSHPAWLAERWMKRFGEQRALALLQANNKPARLCCAVLDEPETPRVEQSLRDAGFAVTPGRWLRSSLNCSGGNPTRVSAYREGLLSFQDEASQMVAHLLDARPGQRVLDLCGAPGGKAILMGRGAGPNGCVIAADLHLHRLRILREQIGRTHSANISEVALDAMRPLPFSRRFDRVLLDAPCSGTGTLARNPEIRWRLKPEDFVRAQESQIAMLRSALTCLTQGGRLVYSTCSLEPEENDAVVGSVLAANARLRLVSGEAALTKHLREPGSAPQLFSSDGTFRTFPPESETDGFFGAVLSYF